MASPYKQPTSTLPIEARQRVKHAVVAGISGLVGGPILFVSIALADGIPFRDYNYPAVEILKTFLCFLIGAVAAGILVLPAQRMPWYWAAVLGAPMSLIVAGILGLAFG